MHTILHAAAAWLGGALALVFLAVLLIGACVIAWALYVEGGKAWLRVSLWRLTRKADRMLTEREERSAQACRARMPRPKPDAYVWSVTADSESEAVAKVLDEWARRAA